MTSADHALRWWRNWNIYDESLFQENCSFTRDCSRQSISLWWNNFTCNMSTIYNIYQLHYDTQFIFCMFLLHLTKSLLRNRWRERRFSFWITNSSLFIYFIIKLRLLIGLAPYRLYMKSLLGKTPEGAKDSPSLLCKLQAQQRHQPGSETGWCKLLKKKRTFTSD